MNKIIFFFLLGLTSISAQKKQLFAEYSIGETSSADNTFIDLKSSQTFGIGYGIQHNDSLNWVKQLRNPYTGFILQVSNHGNVEKIGYSISLLPYIEKPIILKNEKLKFLAGLGVAYHTKKYDFAAMAPLQAQNSLEELKNVKSKREIENINFFTVKMI